MPPAHGAPLPCRSLAIVLPEPNSSSVGLAPWLHSLTAIVLPGLLRQADPQHVIEYSLALITVLNEVSRGGRRGIPGTYSWAQRPELVRASQRSHPWTLN